MRDPLASWNDGGAKMKNDWRAALASRPPPAKRRSGSARATPPAAATQSRCGR